MRVLRDGLQQLVARRSFRGLVHMVLAVQFALDRRSASEGFHHSAQSSRHVKKRVLVTSAS